MGGQGSGRPPSVETIIKRMTEPTTTINTPDSVFLPNFSGLKEGLKNDSPDVFVRKAGDTMTGNLTISSLTSGSVLVAGTDGIITEDNSQLYWDTANNRLGIGTATPSTTIQCINNNKSFSFGGTTELVVNKTVGSVTTLKIANNDTGGISNSTITLQDYSGYVWDLTLGNPTTGVMSMVAQDVPYITFNSDLSKTIFNIGEWDIDTYFYDDNGNPALFIQGNNGQIGIGTSAPVNSAMLEINSTIGTLLLARMTTTQRDALIAANGMILYNTTTATIQGYQGGAWTNL